MNDKNDEDIQLISQKNLINNLFLIEKNSPINLIPSNQNHQLLGKNKNEFKKNPKKNKNIKKCTIF